MLIFSELCGVYMYDHYDKKQWTYLGKLFAVTRYTICAFLSE